MVSISQETKSRHPESAIPDFNQVASLHHRAVGTQVDHIVAVKVGLHRIVVLFGILQLGIEIGPSLWGRVGNAVGGVVGGCGPGRCRVFGLPCPQAFTDKAFLGSGAELLGVW